MAGLESEAILLEYDAIIDIIREISDGTVIVSTEELKNIQVTQIAIVESLYLHNIEQYFCTIGFLYLSKK